MDSSSDINTAVRLMKAELNTIGQAVGQLQGQVNELNARLSTPAPTPSGWLRWCLLAIPPEEKARILR
ncbi:hypothetical protein V8E54_004609 [Elaphomyces granulatus]